MHWKQVRNQELMETLERLLQRKPTDPGAFLQDKELDILEVRELPG